MTWRGAGIGSFRYGPCALWTVDGDLSGGRASRFAGRVELFFRSGEKTLMIDLRRTGFVDSAGAAALARLRAAHPGLQVIGRPASWGDFPVAVRCALLALDAAGDIQSALGPRLQADASPERRRHPRIPLQLPVELFFGGRRFPAELRNLSRGGVRIAVDPALCATPLPAGEVFDLLGLAEDPLGREVTGCGSAPVRLASVGGPAAEAVGARFTDSPPPV